MGTVNEKLSFLNDTKYTIKKAIEDKGVTIPSNTTFRQYAAKIYDIESQGSIKSKLEEIINDPTILGTEDQLTDNILQTKDSIKQAIVSKNISVAEDTPFSQYSDKILEIPDYSANAKIEKERLEEIINDPTVVGSNLDLISNISSSKNKIKEAIINKGIIVNSATPFSDYSTKISNITNGDLPSPSEKYIIQRKNYKSASRMQFAIAYQKTHNRFPELKRLLVCFHWTHGDTQVFKVGGPNNYKVELHTGKLYTGDDLSNVTNITHNWNVLNKEDAPENDEDTSWNLGFGIATTYMDGNEYDQTIEITSAYHTQAYILLDGCSVHLSCLSGVGEAAILDSINGGKYLLSTQEDIDILKTIKPEYIKGLAIEYNNLSQIFPNEIKYLAFDSIVTTSSIIELPMYLEELENIDMLLDLGLTSGDYSRFFHTTSTYIGDNITFEANHAPFVYTCSSGMYVAPNFIFNENSDASSLFDSWCNLQHIQSIEFRNCSDLDLSYMFVRCYSLKCPELFDTSLAKNMRAMFLSCYNLETIPLYDTTNVDNTSIMFSHCFSLKEVPAIDMSNVIDAEDMFEGCISLEYLHMKNIGVDLDISVSIKFTADSLFEVISNLKNNTFKTLTIGAENLAKLTNSQKAVATKKGWTLK